MPHTRVALPYAEQEQHMHTVGAFICMHTYTLLSGVVGVSVDFQSTKEDAKQEHESGGVIKDPPKPPGLPA